MFTLLTVGSVNGFFCVDPAGTPLRIVCIVLSPLAAVWTGCRFSSPSWVAGPPAAILATLLAMLIAPEVGPSTPDPMGNMTAKDELMFFLAWGGIGVVLLIALVFALLAWVGVRHGQR